MFLCFLLSSIPLNLRPRPLVRTVAYLPALHTLVLLCHTDAKAAADKLAREVSKQGFSSFQSVVCTMSWLLRNNLPSQRW